MDYNTFKQEILTSLKKEAGEKMVTLHRIEKNNGKILDAVTIMESGTHIAPTIYLADFYDFFSHGMSLEEVTLKILELNTERQVEETEFQNAGFEDYKRARSHICYKLINLDMNRKLLKNVPYIPYLDLAIVFYYRLEEEVLNGANFLVHNCNLESWGITLQDIYEDAHKNTSRRLPFTLQGMEALIREMTGEEELLSFGFQKESRCISLPMKKNILALRRCSILMYFLTSAGFCTAIFMCCPAAFTNVFLCPIPGSFPKKNWRQWSERSMRPRWRTRKSFPKMFIIMTVKREH